jgi:hypothetical protein
MSTALRDGGESGRIVIVGAEQHACGAQNLGTPALLGSERSEPGVAQCSV